MFANVLSSLLCRPRNNRKTYSEQENLLKWPIKRRFLKRNEVLGVEDMYHQIKKATQNASVRYVKHVEWYFEAFSDPQQSLRIKTEPSQMAQKK